MFDSPNLDDAIAQLEILGIDRQKAIKALSRYNYDVERAADYIFSGNAISDDDDKDDNDAKTTDWHWSQPAAFDAAYAPDSEQPTPSNRSQSSVYNAAQSASDSPKPVVLVKDYDKPAGSDNDPFAQHASSSMALVPFDAKDDDQDHVPGQFTPAKLTWWTDPEDPSQRQAQPLLPIGLRPPAYNFAYSPILLQMLFHVSVFRHAVLAHRPVPYAWGSCRNYWKGYGEAVPGYILHPIQHDSRQEQQQQPTVTSSTSTMSTSTSTSTGDAIPNWPRVEEERTFDLPPTMQHSDLETMPKHGIVLAEMQKLFAFMGNTKRLYGSTAPFVRALNSRTAPTATGWQNDDKMFDEFMDSLIGNLMACDDSPNATRSLKQMFRLCAEMETGRRRMSTDELSYLVLGTTERRDSFYACLDPLVYEQRRWGLTTDEKDDDDVSKGSSDDDEDAQEMDPQQMYKLTTFTVVPPLLLVVLEDRRNDNDNDSDDQTRRGATKASLARSSYQIDETVYMDRYLTSNKQIILEKHRQGDQWRQEMLTIRSQIDRLRSTAMNTANSAQSPSPQPLSHSQAAPSLPSRPPTASSPSSTLTKDELLNHTSRYLNSKIASLENNELYADQLKTIDSVLQHVKSAIEVERQECMKRHEECRRAIQDLFVDERLKQRPYDLRATLHHDGMNGTGHYWSYVWVEPEEVNLLEDIPVANAGGWYRFCDADVRKVTIEDVLDEPVVPFALLYCDRTLPVIPSDQIKSQVPADLLELIEQDNEQFEGEIAAYRDAPTMIDRSDTPCSNVTDHGSSVEMDASKPNPEIVVIPTQPPPAYASWDTSNAIVIDDSTDDSRASINSSPGPEETRATPSPSAPQTEAANEPTDAQHNLAIDLMMTIRDCPGDDPRLLVDSFHTFLARVGHADLVARYIATVDAYSQDPEQDASSTSNESQLRSKLAEMPMEAIESVVAFDASLSSLFASYQDYVAMGLAVAGALMRFISDDHDGAVVALLKYKQLHGTWRSSLMMGAHWQFTSALDMLDFNDLAIAFGTRCIQTLNREAYDKASSIAQCTEGLHQAARLANLAQLLVAAPKTAQGDRLLADMSDLWLRFSDMLGANALTADQSNLLSGLIMIYLDGPAHADLAALHAEIDKTQLPDTAILQKYTTLLDDARARL